ncbi:MAG: hypothetical protein ACRCY4_06215 [Brevinema sp.]
MQKIEILIANPAGNTTIFVKSPTNQADYSAVALFLLTKKEFKAEQIAFIHDYGLDTLLPEMHMAGMEFCGNATRSFALLLAHQYPKIYHQKDFLVKVSGATKPLPVYVDVETSNARVSMPVDFQTSLFYFKNHPLFQVSFEGITHLIAFDIPFSMEIFNEIKTAFYQQFNPPAFRVMFINHAKMSLTPLVFVRDINSTFLESSCGSGTVAVAVSLSQSLENGTESFSISQPGGILTSCVTKKDGVISALTLEGFVSFSKPIFLDFF